MSPRVLPALVVPTARAMPWRPFAAAAGLGLLIVAVPALSGVSLRDRDLATLLRLAAACGAVGAAFLLDDPAARGLAAVPTPRLARQLVRAVLAALAVTVWWARCWPSPLPAPRTAPPARCRCPV
ncbi:hypothetical protein [Phytohabitans suffuscus]|uniref:Uncharacterized protein n=1 Tax=Phytohabitans suffuscus TaxID=624315 RepID=A0A6F8YRZ8_9ACTN|nr:hypothetical protein [Phytohabitans suffuscus]BCB88763.1 hypothetical protein Psuf_060760 [Phytohabitans suffuscus]